MAVYSYRVRCSLADGRQCDEGVDNRERECARPASHLQNTTSRSTHTMRWCLLCSLIYCASAPYCLGECVFFLFSCGASLNRIISKPDHTQPESPPPNHPHVAHTKQIASSVCFCGGPQLYLRIDIYICTTLCAAMTHNDPSNEPHSHRTHSTVLNTPHRV